MENLANNYAHIKGWGVDADPENEPTYPMKNYTGDDHNRLNYERPVQQSDSVEILHSNERPTVSAVFGTTNPPSGLSGVLRRQAFKYSENHWGHWLTLILADRINVVEGIIQDLAHGHIPNILAEKGIKADWKYSKKIFAQRIITTVVITSAVIALLYSKNKKRKRKAYYRANDEFETSLNYL